MMISLETTIEQYLQERRAEISLFLELHLDNSECFKIQRTHLVKDLIKNPINVFWAMPYFFIKKASEASEKLGVDNVAAFLQKIPRSFRTSYQKSIERLLVEDLFKLSELEMRLRPLCSPELLKSIMDNIRAEVTHYCTRQGEVSDLIASGLIVILSHLTFGDKSLDLFGIGSKIAGKYAHKKAASNFFLGEKMGNAFYSFAPPTPSEKHVFIFTCLVIILFALLTTAVAVFSFPTQKRFGITYKQLHKVIDQINDRLLLTLAKSVRKNGHTQTVS